MDIVSIAKHQFHMDEWRKRIVRNNHLAYDDIEGGVCQTLFPRRLTQREAAIEAVKVIGLPIISEIDMRLFGDMKQEADMFEKRLSELKKYV